MTVVVNKVDKERQERLRALAGQTLQAYRALNEAAADASLPARARKNGDGLSRASELLERVLADLKEVPVGAGS